MGRDERLAEAVHVDEREKSTTIDLKPVGLESLDKSPAISAGCATGSSNIEPSLLTKETFVNASAPTKANRLTLQQ